MHLTQHLTSAQHEHFERNLANFKEIDQYINDTLSFAKCLAAMQSPSAHAASK